MESKTFSGASLEEALKGDVFSQSEVVRIGMVKQSQNPGYISFTGGGCENWIDIPVDMIESAVQMGSRPCKDHSHPVFRISLKTPKDPQSQIFASLLAQDSAGSGMGQMSQAQIGIAPVMPGSGGPQQMMRSGMSSPGQPGGGMGPSSSARLSTGGLGGFGGGLGAWGCWDSTCTTCDLYEYVCNGTACWWICKIWHESPCERCIWPW